MKDSNAEVKTQYVRIFFWFLYPGLFIGAILWQTSGQVTYLLAAIAIALVVPVPLILFLNRTSGFLASLYGGSGGAISLKDQLAGEITKARYLKSERRFEEALATADHILDHLPDHPEALLLKAQILTEGFSEYLAAKHCLRKLLDMESGPDRVIRQWAEGLLEDVNLQLEREMDQRSH